MESARLPRPVNLPSAVQLGLVFALLLLAALGWAVTDERMRDMDAGPASDPGALGFWITAWIVMMAAMMFPSIAPMVLMYARIERGKRERGAAAGAGATPLFVAGYLITWAAAGLVGFSIIEIGQALSLGFLAWDEGGPYVTGGVIAAAAIYQLTPLKDVCLSKCRSPLMFVLQSWRPGRLGALRMGIEHGGWCVGCCWALMAALFAIGVMSVGWMAFIAALIAIEKLLPWKALANRGIAIVLLVLGLSVAIAPEDVPGLTLPDSPEAVRAMEAMGMEGGAMEGEGMKDGAGDAGMKDDAMKGGGAGGGMKDDAGRGGMGAGGSMGVSP